MQYGLGNSSAGMPRSSYPANGHASICAPIGEFMTITISNLNVAANALFGTTVGILTAIDNAENTIPSKFILTKTASGYFAVSNNNLITNWKGSIAPGHYSVRVRAYGIDGEFTTSATFTIAVTRVEPPPPPKPTGVTFTSVTTSLADNSPAGTTVGVFSVPMSDGSKFSGSLAATPADTVAVSANMRLVLARRLRAADDGSHQWGVTATQGGVGVSGSVQVQVTPANPLPPAPQQPNKPSTPPPPPPPHPRPPPAPAAARARPGHARAGRRVRDGRCGRGHAALPPLRDDAGRLRLFRIYRGCSHGHGGSIGHGERGACARADRGG